MTNEELALRINRVRSYTAKQLGADSLNGPVH